MGAVIRPCSCQHEGQDRMYGKSRRVFSKTQKNVGGNRYKYRCTVCLNEREF